MIIVSSEIQISNQIFQMNSKLEGNDENWD